MAEARDDVERSAWAGGSAMMREYYDREWGRPVTGEAELFERVSLEGFQAGLSWATILARREGFRAAFSGFDPEAVARYGEDDVDRLVGDARIIRNRPKIEATVGNARATLALREAAAGEECLAGFGLPLRGGGELRIPPGLPALIWRHCPARTPVPAAAEEVPTVSAESRALAAELKRRGFRFVGPTTVYALMEACGLVDTHWLRSHLRGVSGVFLEDGRRAGALPGEAAESR